VSPYKVLYYFLLRIPGIRGSYAVFYARYYLDRIFRSSPQYLQVKCPQYFNSGSPRASVSAN